MDLLVGFGWFGCVFVYFVCVFWLVLSTVPCLFWLLLLFVWLWLVYYRLFDFFRLLTQRRSLLIRRGSKTSTHLAFPTWFMCSWGRRVYRFLLRSLTKSYYVSIVYLGWPHPKPIFNPRGGGGRGGGGVFLNCVTHL